MLRNLVLTRVQQNVVGFTQFQYLPKAAKYKKNDKFITNVNDKNTYFSSLTFCIVIYTKLIKNKNRISIYSTILCCHSVSLAEGVSTTAYPQ